MNEEKKKILTFSICICICIYNCIRKTCGGFVRVFVGNLFFCGLDRGGGFRVVLPDWREIGFLVYSLPFYLLIVRIRF